MRSASTSLSFVTLVVLLSLLAPAAAQQARLPARHRTLLLFKSLTYDARFRQTRDAVRVGVLARRSSSASVAIAREMEAQIRALSHLRLSGLAISAELLLAETAAEARALIEGKRVNVLYLAPALDRVLDAACELGPKRKIIITSGEPEHARRCAALAFTLVDGKPRILVNPRQGALQGAAFRAELLKLAEQVR